MAVNHERRGGGIGTALVDRLAADEAAAGTRLLLVMTSGDANEYAPTRAFYRARGFLPAKTFPAGGTTTCLSFWSDLCSLGHHVDALLSAGRRSGSELLELLRRVGQPLPDPGIAVPVTHATTCVAMRYAEGVVMAGDRRATSGQPHQPPDDGEGLPGRPPLRHRYRRRGRSCARDGEALPAAARALREGRGRRAQPRRQGEPAEPDGPVEPARGDAGSRRRPDLRRASTPGAATGRLFSYDVTGGRYEERDHSATGSGSLHAGTVIKVGYHEGMHRDEAVDLCLRALFEAADEDSATGGPDLMRESSRSSPRSPRTASSD